MPDIPRGHAPTEFSVFIEGFKQTLKHQFHVRADIDRLSTQRGLPPFMLREIMADNPLATFVPRDCGGRGGRIHEGLALLAAAGYESLPLSLGFGINWALFLQPVSKYGQEAIRESLLHDFLEQRKMGGLMITEPDFGSDALHMRTRHTRHGRMHHLQGTKHWAGLTGWADYWLLTAREQTPSGDLQRDIDFFICDVSLPEEQIQVEEVYDNLGIYLLPYGRNRIDVRIPTERKLQPHSTGIKMMLDLLHRSRLQFPGMGMGFLQRLLDEAVEHCRQRRVGGRSLFQYDQVQQRLSMLQAATTICSAMCLNSSHKAGLQNNLATFGLEANAVKTYLTDLMQDAAQSLLQLVGAKGYRLSHIAGRALVDSRPFQIFEGSNDILYIQIAEAVQKQMQRAKETSLNAFLQRHPLTARAAGIVGKHLDFRIADDLSQRRQTSLGRIISRVIGLNQVEILADTPFDRRRILQAQEAVEQQIAALAGGFRNQASGGLIEGNSGPNAWLDCFSDPQTA